MTPVTGMPQSNFPGSGDHPLLPQVEVITPLSPLQVKVSMDPPIVTGGVLVMVTPAACSRRCGTHNCKYDKETSICMFYDYKIAAKYNQ